MRAAIVGLSFSHEARQARYVPIGHEGSDDERRPARLRPARRCRSSRAAALERLKPLLEDPAVRKVGHDLKFDLIVLAQSRHHAARHRVRLDAWQLPARCHALRSSHRGRRTRTARISRVDRGGGLRQRRTRPAAGAAVAGDDSQFRRRARRPRLAVVARVAASGVGGAARPGPARAGDAAHAGARRHRARRHPHRRAGAGRPVARRSNRSSPATPRGSTSWPARSSTSTRRRSSDGSCSRSSTSRRRRRPARRDRFRRRRKCSRSSRSRTNCPGSSSSGARCTS